MKAPITLVPFDLSGGGWIKKPSPIGFPARLHSVTGDIALYAIRHRIRVPDDPYINSAGDWEYPTKEAEKDIYFSARIPPDASPFVLYGYADFGGDLYDETTFRLAPIYVLKNSSFALAEGNAYEIQSGINERIFRDYKYALEFPDRVRKAWEIWRAAHPEGTPWGDIVKAVGIFTAGVGGMVALAPGAVAGAEIPPVTGSTVSESVATETVLGETAAESPWIEPAVSKSLSGLFPSVKTLAGTVAKFSLSKALGIGKENKAQGERATLSTPYPFRWIGWVAVSLAVLFMVIAIHNSGKGA